VEIPAGSFRVSSRLNINPTKPFALKGLAPDVSRLVWTGKTTEGVCITPKGSVDPCCNDGSVTVTGMQPAASSQQPGAANNGGGGKKGFMKRLGNMF
jgi:hypothetical protein